MNPTMTSHNGWMPIGIPERRPMWIVEDVRMIPTLRGGRLLAIRASPYPWRGLLRMCRCDRAGAAERDPEVASRPAIRRRVACLAARGVVRQVVVDVRRRHDARELDRRAA